MRLLLAILVGKLISYLTKLLKIGGGSAAPGLYALSLEPKLVEKLAVRIPQNIVITGTNGKTTTAKLISHFAEASGLRVIRNHTGSNLERGIASTLISHYTLNPRPYVSEGKKSSAYTLDLGIWELDEAAFNTVAPKLKPDIIIFLNVFRDQLDRYGEIDTVVKNWCQTLQKVSPKTIILVNGDDANIVKLSKCFKGKIQKFGVKDYKIKDESIQNTKRPSRWNYRVEDVKLNGLNNSSFLLQTTNYKLQTTLPLPGLYHIYDFLAAFAAGINLGFQPKQMALSLEKYSPAFGRVEKFNLNEGKGYIFLIKNPAGATQVFETIGPNIKPEDKFLLALNDNIADGKDVSWIWDADFKKLRTTNCELRTICSGTRAFDLAVRLKYAGFNPKQIAVYSDLKTAFKEATKGLKGRLFVLPTYTAMLELQSILAKTGLKKQYWEEF